MSEQQMLLIVLVGLSLMVVIAPILVYGVLMPRVKAGPTPKFPLHAVKTPKGKIVQETTCLRINPVYPDVDPWKLLYNYDADAKLIADTFDEPWPLVWTSRGYKLIDVVAKAAPVTP